LFDYSFRLLQYAPNVMLRAMAGVKQLGPVNVSIIEQEEK